ncbi:aldehyde dehydrogenase family protein [Paraburkholderia xenovorans LB400]|uniref:Phenylacetaldehyde dehydrogenase n=1 Tax=Paraburkholderia xenovorans (strain LB400) TaxID=266265 RepID=Q13JB2_PARXL|nr:aldehyde dehydrogenase family protein [Paraburkholderia xenovorans]ABE35827.1 putative phenylacetaldehyde dehydrogenase [Paraburkholderia xenovorans LB400]AIP35912.1 aldehyde dehydrogenase family protein [Paraburkholderia xenovorans LB400]
MADIRILSEVETFLARQHRQYIDGQAVAAMDTVATDIINPSNRKVVASVRQATPAQVQHAVASAHEAFTGVWQQTSAARRGELLNRLADLMQAHREELAQIESLSSGKLIGLSRAFEIDYSIAFLRYYAGWATKIHGQTMNLSLPSSNGEQYTGFTLRQPIGVVAGIVPWNFSIMIAVWKFGSALACGCTAVIKPSEFTPLTMLRVAELALEAGIPPGVLNIVNGNGRTVGTALIAHPKVAKVTFTGSVPTGVGVGVAAMQAGLKHVTLELGGKNPAGFLRDFPVERTVDGIIEAAYLHQGEVCASAERFYVHRSRIDDVLEALHHTLATLKIGSALDESAQFGPLANAAHFAKVMAFFEKARAQDGEIVHGGTVAPGDGFFVQPTAIPARSQADTIMTEETFGPVASFLAYDDEEEMLHYMNDTHFGLTASIWTNDLSKALRFVPRVEAGTVWVNMHNYIDPAMPFGGVKSSGIGREFGEAFIEYFTELKSVIVRY